MPRATPSRTFGRANFLIILPREESFGTVRRREGEGGREDPIFAGYRELAWLLTNAESRDDSGSRAREVKRERVPLDVSSSEKLFPGGSQNRLAAARDSPPPPPTPERPSRRELVRELFQLNARDEFPFRVVSIIPSIRSAAFCCFFNLHISTHLMCFQQLLFDG